MSGGERSRRYRAKHPERVAAAARAWRASNPDRTRELNREWAAANPDKVRDHQYRKKYGISLADYERMYAEQSGLCAICGRPEEAVDHRSKETRRLAVDHCADTGAVRMLLCTNCNTAIGLFKHDPEIMLAAARYASTEVAA